MHRIDACPRPTAAPDKSEASAAEAIAKRAAKGGKWFEDMCAPLGLDPGRRAAREERPRRVAPRAARIFTAVNERAAADTPAMR